MFRVLIGLLESGNISRVGETSTQRIELSPSYFTDTKKFIDDTTSSLNNYTSNFIQNVDTMVMDLEDFNTKLQGRLVDLRKQGEHIIRERNTLREWLHDFVRNI